MESNPKNILYIEINTDGTIGGSHLCLYEMVKYIDRRKYIPFVIFFQDNQLMPDFRKICDPIVLKLNPVLVLRRDLPSFYQAIEERRILKKGGLSGQKLVNFFGSYIPSLFQIYKFIKRNNIKLVHLNNGPDMTDWLLVSKAMGVKVVSHLRFPWSPTRFRKFLACRYDRIIAISDFVATELDKIGVSRKNVVTIHDGIDIGLLEASGLPRSEISREFDIPNGAPVLCEIGNIRRWKGQHVAIEAVRLLAGKYKDLRLFIVGEISNSENDVEYLKYLKELTIKYGLERNIIFTGYRKDALSILAQSDIMIHTSIFPEPLGRVILEGMIFRKPVIATNHGGPLESIEEGKSGFLVEPENPKVLAEKISFLLEHGEEAKNIGENARRHVEEKFGIRNNIRKIEEMYDNILLKT